MAGRGAAHRAAVAAGRLGFADLYLVSVPPPGELRRRRDADTTRRRRTFDLHVRLAEPLRDWYGAVEQAGAAAVCWDLPAQGIPAVAARRGNRSDPDVFDAVLRALPGPIPASTAHPGGAQSTACGNDTYGRAPGSPAS